MKRIRLLVIGISLGLSFGVQAQESLSLKQILKKAKSYNQDLKLKKAEKKVAKYSKREALGSALPQISADIRHIQNFDVPSFGGFQLQGDYGTEYGISVNQPIYTFGAVSAALDAAKAGYEMVDLDIEATENDLEYKVKKAYFQFLLAKRNQEIYENMLQNAQDNYNILRQSFRGGRPPQGDIIRLQADIENKKPQVANAKVKLKNAMITLNVLMGEDPGKTFIINDKLQSQFPTLSQPELQNMLNKMSPNLKVLEKNAEYQDSLADVKWSKQMPKLGLFYNFNHQDQSYSGRFDQDRTLKTSTLGIALTWNIWDGGVSNAQYQKAKVQASKVDFNLQKTKDSLNQSLRAAVEQFKTYKDNVRSFKKGVSLARRSFKLNQKRFRSGQTSIADLNDTQSVLLQAQMQQASNLFQMNATYSLIEKLIGKDIN